MFKKIKQKTQHLSFNQKMVLFIVSFFVLIFILFLIFVIIGIFGMKSETHVSRDYRGFDSRYMIENKYY